MVLEKMKKIAESHVGAEVTDAVVTVPAYFNLSQKRATRDACKIAGLNCHRIISEPQAAALAYGYQSQAADGNSSLDLESKTIMVFDFGGGTLDVTIIQIDDGIVDIEATRGDSHLGGTDIDRCIYDWAV